MSHTFFIPLLLDNSGYEPFGGFAIFRKLWCVLALERRVTNG